MYTHTIFSCLFFSNDRQLLLAFEVFKNMAMNLFCPFLKIREVGSYLTHGLADNASAKLMVFLHPGSGT